MIEADGESAVERMLLGCLQLDVDLPLQELVKHYTAPVLLTESASLRRLRVLILGGPLRPVPQIMIPTVQMLVEGAIGGELFQQVSFASQELLELRIYSLLAIPSVEQDGEDPLENSQFERAEPFVLDEGGCAQSFDFLLHG